MLARICIAGKWKHIEDLDINDLSLKYLEIAKMRSLREQQQEDEFNENWIMFIQ